MRRIVVLLIWGLLSSVSVAQPAFPFITEGNGDTFDRIEKSQTAYLDSLYLDETGVSRMFIKGKGYIPYYVRSQNKPVLRYKEDRTASLIFDGRRFDGVGLQYDTFKDQVVYTDKALIYNNILCQVALCEDNVSQFDLYFRGDTMTFRYFKRSGDSTFSLKEGFYEVVHENRCKYLIKHVSTRNAYDVTDEYDYSPVSYLNIGEGFFALSTKGRFIKMFGDESVAVREYIKMRKIKFRLAGKEQIAGIIRYYESITTGDI